MIKYLLANWKAEKTIAEASAWLDEFLRLYRPDPRVEVIIAPPAIALVPIQQKLIRDKIAHLSLAVQDLSPFPMGPYTGGLAADMLREVVDFAIVGHSERRRYFHETNQDVAGKVREAGAAGIRPIVCVDHGYVKSQLAALDEEDLDHLIIGYGPVEAAGVDLPQSVEKVQGVVAEIGRLAPRVPVLYGGSINKDNACDYFEIAGVAGLMVGTASLAAEEFALICQAASAACQ